MMEQPNGQKPKIPAARTSEENKLEKAKALTETMAAIREGIESAERGEMKPAAQVFAEMKAHYGLHGQGERSRDMKERITIHFAGRADGGQDVGVEYHAETSEWTLQDAMLAKETAMHTLLSVA